MAEVTTRVKLSSADRVLFPDDGVTKGDLFEYYGRVPEWIVPHLRDRQFTTHPREGGERLVDFALVNSAEAVRFMVQNNCIDMNAWYSRVDKPHRPDFVLFDLDPPDDPNGFELAIDVAHRIHELLDEVG